MIRLAMLLVGARVLRRKWRARRARDVVDSARARNHGRRLQRPRRRGRRGPGNPASVRRLPGARAAHAGATPGYTVVFKSLALVLGCMILDSPVQVDIENSLLFGLAFLIDGAMRIATASLVRFPRGTWSPSVGRSNSALAALPLPTGRSATSRPCRSASAWRCYCPAGPASGLACGCEA